MERLQAYADTERQKEKARQKENERQKQAILQAKLRTDEELRERADVRKELTQSAQTTEKIIQVLAYAIFAPPLWLFLNSFRILVAGILSILLILIVWASFLSIYL